MPLKICILYSYHPRSMKDEEHIPHQQTGMGNGTGVGVLQTDWHLPPAGHLKSTVVLAIRGHLLVPQPRTQVTRAFLQVTWHFLKINFAETAGSRTHLHARLLPRVSLFSTRHLHLALHFLKCLVHTTEQSARTALRSRTVSHLPFNVYSCLHGPWKRQHSGFWASHPLLVAML